MLIGPSAGRFYLKGASDNTLIGNVNDAIKVNISSLTNDSIPVSHVDTDNSTSTPLGVGGVFTGDWHEISKYSSLLFTILTDQYSAVDGMELEFSKNGSAATITRKIKTTALPIAEGIFFSIPVEDAYYRIIYTNGAVAQAAFRLTAQLKTDNVALSSIPPIVRSILSGKSIDSNLFENINTRQGRLLVENVVVPAPIGGRFEEYAKNGVSIEMAVDGGVTPVEFIVDANATLDLVVTSLSFQAFDGAIKIDTFLGSNNEITNGLIVEIKSEDIVFQFLPIKNTTEFNSLFAFGAGRAFDLIFANGDDSLVSIFAPESPFVIKKQGTYATDDYIKVIIQDDIDAVSRLRFLASGTTL
jgi:hypothetical protein